MPKVKESALRRIAAFLASRVQSKDTLSSARKPSCTCVDGLPTDAGEQGQLSCVVRPCDGFAQRRYISPAAVCSGGQDTQLRT
jgi:hypothetical protein